MIKKALSLALMLSLATAGCGSTDKNDGTGKKSSGNSSQTLVVFAAASLTETFTALGKTFESGHPGVRVKFNFGGSSTLAQQIDQGAPADVFAAASPATMKQVTDAGLASNPTVFVRNRLEIAVPTGDPSKVKTLKDLTDPKRKVVLCAPQVPCGAAALKALKAAGLTIKPVSQEQDVKAALTKVQLNEADAALVYRTDVKASAGKVDGIEFPEADKAINDYPIAPLTKAPRAGLANDFVQLVLSPQGTSTFIAAGFDPA
jgi:molybdate transport system substrate-binding protein